MTVNLGDLALVIVWIFIPLGAVTIVLLEYKSIREDREQEARDRRERDMDHRLDMHEKAMKRRLETHERVVSQRLDSQDRQLKRMAGNPL